jgi:hypothetical protein
MGWWDSIKKTTTAITTAVMPSGANATEEVMKTQPAEKGTVKPAPKTAPKTAPKPKSKKPKNKAGTVEVKPKKK